MGLIHEFGDWHRAIDHSPSLRGATVNPLGRQYQPSRAFGGELDLGSRPGKLRISSETNFRHSDFRLLGGNSQVADADERRTAAQGEPVDGGDKDRGMLPNRDQHFNPVRAGIRRGPRLAIRACFLQIDTRAEAVTTTGQYDRSAFSTKGGQRGKKLAT